MYYNEILWRKMNDANYQPTKDDIAYLLARLQQKADADSLALERFEKIIRLFESNDLAAESNDRETLALMVYQARCGKLAIDLKSDIEETFDRIEELKHRNKNVMNPDLEAELKDAQESIKEDQQDIDEENIPD